MCAVRCAGGYRTPQARTHAAEHRRPYDFSRNADNLETLCRACHAIAHGVKPPLAEGLAFDEYGNVVEAALMPKPADEDDEFY